MAKFAPRSQTAETDAPAEIPETHGPELVPPIATTARRGAGRPKGSKNRRKPRSRIGKREERAMEIATTPQSPWANAPLHAWAEVVKAMPTLPRAGLLSAADLFGSAYEALTAYGAAKYDAKQRGQLVRAVGYALLILEAEGG